MNPKHQIFLTEVLRHGDALRAYQKAYPDASGESLRVAANRLLHTPGIAGRIDAFHEAVRSYIEEDIAAYKLKQVEEIRCKREVLKAIYTKTMETHRTIPSRMYETRQIVTEPTNAEILKAIQLDNHLAEKEMELLAFEPVSVYDNAGNENAATTNEETVTNSNNDEATAPLQEAGVNTPGSVTNSNNAEAIVSTTAELSSAPAGYTQVNKQNHLLNRLKHKSNRKLIAV